MTSGKVKITPAVKYWINAITAEFGETEMVDRRDIEKLMQKDSSLKWPTWLSGNLKLRYSRGEFVVPMLDGSFENNGSFKNVGINISNKPAVKNTDVVMEMIVVEKNEVKAENVTEEIRSLIPKNDPTFVKWGYFKDVLSVLKSEKFYPIFVTGLSGNGKTFMLEQVCATLKRPIYRANITAETDEDDLLGGFRLIDGATVWHNGPVVEAMQAGAILLLDEVDLGTEKLMCLQPVLEGKGVYIKKINKFIEPAHGFNIVATANTKGKGSDSGQFIGTNVMNEAFLDRFPITLEQPYPDKGVETKILMNTAALSMDVTEVESDFITKLVTWGEAVRKLYAEDGIDEVITTRRLVHIINAYSIFGKNKMKAIKMATARFDEEVKTQLLSFYTKIDDTIEKEKRKAFAPNHSVNPDVDDVDAGKLDETGSADCPF